MFVSVPKVAAGRHELNLFINHKDAQILVNNLYFFVK